MQLEVNNISYSYSNDEQSVLKNISFSIKNNEFIGLIGKTGSGKSTLIQHLNGLYKPTSGSIKYNGKDISEKGFNLKAFRQEVSMVFQYPEHQLFEETVIKDICFGPLNKGLSIEEATKVSKWAADIVGIDESMLDKSPFELSGGWQRRVAIAGVLAIKPKLLILDEPSAGLDPRGKKLILDQINNIYHSTDMSIVLVSHSMDDISEYTNRVIVLNDGKLMLDDKTSKVFENENLLTSIGLGIPNIDYIINRLNENGFKIQRTKNNEELADSIMENINRC